ncbi:MAG: class II aldolase/adducin family protein [Spirochaetes bacterium]|nr:class II aldolase/adducin family protein [Spirochaetota bacterium]
MKYLYERIILLKTLKKVQKENLVIGTWGNFSIRVNENIFIITPSGMNYNKIKLNDLVVLDMNENIIEGKRKPSVEYFLHLSIYKNRKDIYGICHTHSDYVKVFSILRKPIPPVCEDLVQLTGGEVPVANYFLPGTKELGKNAVLTLKDKNALILPNHGLVTCGRNIDEALKIAEVIERNSKTIILSYIIGNPIPLDQNDIETMRNFYINKYGQKK